MATVGGGQLASLSWPERGDVTAQFHLGAALEDAGEDAQALLWYRKAAEQGLSEAQFILGVRYFHGRGIQEDKAEGIRWFRQAAEQGHLSAQFELGCCLLFTSDAQMAAYWFEKAAQNGHARAHGMLGVLYENGRGVQQSYTAAVFWYQKAVAGGDAIGQHQLANLYDNGYGDLSKDPKSNSTRKPPNRIIPRLKVLLG